MKFIIVTGMSGAGKRSALKLLEDMGFFCVDNLPLPLIEKFAELAAEPGTEITKVAVCLDVRTDSSFEEVEPTFVRLEKKGLELEILFMDASDKVLVRRYKESRRPHPLASNDGDLAEDGIRKERGVLATMKKRADFVIDTSNLLTRELKEEMERIFRGEEAYNSLMVSIISFGFKNGIPPEADLVFDVRFLPNPFYIEELKEMTGNDKPVSDYVMSFPEAEEFLGKLTEMLQFLIPYYVREGKYQLVVGIGCTGGQHRSVTLANGLFKSLQGGGSYGLTIRHRDAKGAGR